MEENDEAPNLNDDPARFPAVRQQDRGRLSGSVTNGMCADRDANHRQKAGGGLRAIDIHHHYIPLELIDEVKRNGKALGVEYFPPKTAKDNPLQIQFPKGNRLNPDPRMAEVNNRLDVMTKGNVGIATVEVHTACVGYEPDGSARRNLVEAL